MIPKPLSHADAGGGLPLTPDFLLRADPGIQDIAGWLRGVPQER